MKFSALLLTLAFSLNLKAFDNDFKVINDRVPLEFEMMFDSLKKEAKQPSEQLKIIALTRDLNENLKNLEKAHLFMLLKTEVIKGVLEHKFRRARPLEVSEQLIRRLETEWSKKQEGYNRFSGWVVQSLIAELRLRRDMGLIGPNAFNPNSFDGQKRIDAVRFQRYLGYMNPWMEKIMTLTPGEFNDLTKKAGLSILQKVNSRSLLFKQFSQLSQTGPAVTVFNIPQKFLDMEAQDIKRMQNDLPPDLTLKEQSKKEKLEAAQIIEKVTPLDMSPISEDVAKELEAEEKKEIKTSP